MLFSTSPSSSSSSPMRLLAILASLLLSLVLLANHAGAAAVGPASGTINDPALDSKTLTAANFQPEVAKGMTLVEFYSPYCIHCKRFAPTFKSLVDIQEHLEEFGFKIRRVNCVTSGDICHGQKIAGYPTLNLYLDSQKTDEYKGDRSFEDLMAYTTAKSSDYRKSKLPQGARASRRDFHLLR